MQIKEVTAADQPALAGFLAHFGNETRDETYWLDRFRLWWDINPAFSEGIARGWMLQDGSRIAGFLGSIPRLFRANGKDFIVHSASTWRVLPEYRQHSLALLFRQIEVAKNTLLFDGTPSEDVAKILATLRFMRLPAKGSHHAFLLPLHPVKVLSRKIGLGGLGRMLAGSLAPFFKIANKSMFLGAVDPRVEIRSLSRADKDFDDLWERTKDHYSTNVRTAQVLNWFCFDSTHFQKHLFGCYVEGRLRGYAVFGEFPWRDLLLWDGMDLWIEKGHEQHVPLLLRAIIQKALDNGHCDILRMSIPNSLYKNMLGILFLHAKPSFFYLKIGIDMQAFDQEINSYFFAQGDYGL